MAEDDKGKKAEQLFEVRYETPDDCVFLVEEYKKKFDLPIEGERVLMEQLPSDETCIQVATCIRVAASDNERYRDAEFLPLMKKYFEAVKNPHGQDFETRVAYFLLGTVADQESVWKTVFTREELATKERARWEHGVVYPQGKPGDPYDLGEVPAELVAYAKRVLLEHLKTTQSWQDIGDVNDLMMRVTQYIDYDEAESDTSFLKVADCDDFVKIIEERREDLGTEGEDMKQELERFDLIVKDKLAIQPRHEDGAE